MNFLKNIPIRYLGELHDIILFNISVDPSEIQNLVPSGIPFRLFDGRAMISIVNVNLKRMNPTFLPSFLNFNYRHVAFRLLVEDGTWNKGQNKGIFFLRSFTERPLIALGGSLLTDYRLHTARMEATTTSLKLREKEHFLEYELERKAPAMLHDELKETTSRLDRAYSLRGNHRMVTQIQREKWPLEEATIRHFKTNFFSSAKAEACFCVNETIYYQWNAPKKID